MEYYEDEFLEFEDYCQKVGKTVKSSPDKPNANSDYLLKNFAKFEKFWKTESRKEWKKSIKAKQKEGIKKKGRKGNLKRAQSQGSECNVNKVIITNSIYLVRTYRLNTLLYLKKVISRKNVFLVISECRCNLS